MILFSCMALAVLVSAAEPDSGQQPGAASAAVTSDAGDSGPSAEELAQFELLKKRRMAERNIPQSAAGTPTVAGVTALAATQGSFQDQERQRSLDFNKQFGAGAYEGLIGFSKRCFFKDGCNRLATADILKGADRFVALERDADQKSMDRKSPAYESRHQEIKQGMSKAMEVFRPRDGARTTYDAELIRVADPIVKKIFSQNELLQYAQQNASSFKSAPSYAYLGQTLNDFGPGPAGKARAAFDAALSQDPRNEEALSGRAQANFNLGDYPGAASDALAALKLDPADKRAHATLMLSEGRVPAATMDGIKARFAAGGAGESGSSVAAGAGSPQAGAGEAGLERGAGEAARRAEALSVEAKRSLGLGDARSAAELLRKAMVLDPRNPQVFSLASIALNRLKSYPEALAAAEEGLKLAPKSAALLISKSFALNHMRDFRGALDAADRALAIDPKDAMAHFNRGAALGGLGDRDGMLAAMKTAAALDAKFAPIYEQAKAMPAGADVLLLFPGETQKKAGSPAAPSQPRSALPAGLALVVGLFALALLAVGAFFLLRRRGAPPPALAPVREAPAVLADKYEVGRQLGAGGMGVVYEGKDRSLERPVAIKRMREEIRWDPRERARFIAEAKLVAQLRHPSVVEVYDIVEQDGEVYLVFEYVPGRTLDEVLEKEERVPFARARDLFRGVASALDYAHGRGVIHRDLKPANVMVDEEGRVRVMDFGIARLVDDAVTRRSGRGAAVGTPRYMAPEQEQGVSRRESDVFSMAACLYEVLTGRPPFGGSGAGLLMNKVKKAFDPASRLAPALPAGIDGLFAKALDPDPERRYASAGELMRDLEAFEAPARAA